MSSSKSLFGRLCALGVVVAGFALFGPGCETGGKEGDVCNPLVQRDECNSGLSCQQITCARAYCCPTNGSSSDPNCNGDHCPSDEAGSEGGEAGSEAGTPETGPGTDAADAAESSALDSGHD